MALPGIYSFTDFRAYLRACFDEKKRRNPRFSLRSAAVHLGISSGSLTRILNGSRAAGPSLRAKLRTYLKLRPREGEFLALLIRFDRESDPAKKRELFAAVLKARDNRGRVLSQDQYRFFENWYTPVIHQLLRLGQTGADDKGLAQSTLPRISPAKARKAIEALRQMGFIRHNEAGAEEAVEPSMTTGDAWDSVAIHSFQRTMALLAADALDTLAKKERDFSTVTVCLSSPGFEKAREVLRRTREKIMAIEAADTEPERVCHLNLQLFPVSRGAEKEETVP